MSEENKDPRPHRENVVLTEASSEKMDRWLEQIAGKRVWLSRKEFLNWFIEKSSENLSNSDLNAIVERYYDEEVFLRRLLRDIKKSKKDGQPGQLEVVVRHRKTELKRETETLEDETKESQPAAEE